MHTKTISVAKLRSNLSDALDSLDEESVLVVTKRGKDQVAIIDIDKFEDLLAASNPEYIKTIEEARKSDRFFSHEEVFGDLD